MDKKILLIDDSKLMRALIKDILKKEGYKNFLEASNSEDAFAIYEKEQPDLVILDIIMKDKSGLDLLKEMKAAYPKSKIVMCSTMSQESIIFEAIKLGAIDFIIKPFKPDKVLGIIKRVLG